MKHEILGEIRRDDEDGEASVTYQGRTLRVRIITDDVPHEETVELATALVKKLAEIDTAAKTIAARDLTDTYNDGWNEYDEAQEDGSFKTIQNPELTPEDFAAKLTLRDVNVTGTFFELFYDDEGMFWGHSVIVTSMDGVAFTDTYAELFG
ncbi:MAG: DUF2262 domain-containing protein [Acidobacteriota bacterium]